MDCYEEGNDQCEGELRGDHREGTLVLGLAYCRRSRRIHGGAGFPYEARQRIDLYSDGTTSYRLPIMCYIQRPLAMQSVSLPSSVSLRVPLSRPRPLRSVNNGPLSNFSTMVRRLTAVRPRSSPFGTRGNACRCPSYGENRATAEIGSPVQGR